jgi:UDP-GlcNAc:undecaprenyl-phosphate GlcNAc-1-phosphate transferase
MDRALLGTIVAAAAFVAAASLVPVAMRIAARLGVLDAPGGRKSHTAPTPRLGGIAILGSFAAVVLGGYVLLPWLSGAAWARSAIGESLELLEHASLVQAKLLGIMAGAVLAFATGLADDLLGARFPVSLKALGQLGAASIPVACGVQTTFLPYEWMNVAATVLWLVGITNAFNLLDNMDGLSASVALVASAVLLVNTWSLGEFFVSLLLLAFMGSLLGFLVFNLRPSFVFMGDCGSYFVGFAMGSVTLLARYVSPASSSLFPVLMPVVVLAIPLVDTFTVIVIRLLDRRPIYVGDRCHLSHRLVDMGFSPRAAVLFIDLAALTLGIGAVSLTDASVGRSALILAQSVGFVALLLVLMFAGRRGPGGEET